MYTEAPRSLGYPDQGGMSNYYPNSSPLSKAEIDAVKEVVGPTLSLRNTRLRKVQQDEMTVYQVLVASVEKREEKGVKPISISSDSERLDVCYGDHSDCLEPMCASLEKAIAYATSSDQRVYLQKLIAAYRSGSIDIHKEASIAWISDKSPVVETWSGFLEPGRDPSGVRCEFEALVAIQDKAWSTAFSTLSDKAEYFILHLPWSGLGKEADQLGPFENEAFIRPEFVALKCKLAIGTCRYIMLTFLSDLLLRQQRLDRTYSTRGTLNPTFS